MVAFKEPNLKACRPRSPRYFAGPPTRALPGGKEQRDDTQDPNTEDASRERARPRVTRARAYRLFFFLPPFFFLAADFFFEPPPPPLFMRLGILPPPAQIFAARCSMASVIL